MNLTKSQKKAVWSHIQNPRFPTQTEVMKKIKVTDRSHFHTICYGVNKEYRLKELNSQV